MPTLTIARIRQIRGLIRHLRHAVGTPPSRTYRRDAVGYLGFLHHTSQPPGMCKWCGRRVPPPNRYWHDPCAVAYRVARGVQSNFRRIPHLRERRCEQCGSTAEPLELDHRIALSVAHARGDWRTLLRAYDISNLRWLCHTCHSAKTGQDRRRANNLAAGRPENWNLTRRRNAPPPGQQALPIIADQE